MVESVELEPFLEEYAHVTAFDLIPIPAGERPDFVCEKGYRRYGRELIRVMRDPVKRRWDDILGGSGHLNGMDATWKDQEVTYAKEKMGWK